VKSVEGKESDSTSRTDTWVLQFHPNVYYEHKHLSKAFVKIWVKPNDPTPVGLSGLEYERNVYHKIVRPLVDFNVCPNFIRVLLIGSGCKYGDIIKWLKNDNMTQQELTIAFNRNVGYMTRSTMMLIDRRPPVTKKLDTTLTAAAAKDSAVRAKSFLYQTLITEYHVSESIHDILTKFAKSPAIADKYFQPHHWGMLFQALCACYAMSCSGLMHSDLHLGNILVQKLNSKRRVIYQYGYVVYDLKTQYQVRVFDFDRSFQQTLGKNVNDLLLHDSVKGKFIEKYDAYYILAGFYNKCKTDKDRKSILNIMLSVEQDDEIIENMAQKPLNLILKNEADFYKRLNSVSEMMKICSTYARADVLDSPSPTSRIYTCNPGMFDNSGVLFIERTTHSNYDLYIENLNTNINTFQQAAVELQEFIKNHRVNMKEYSDQIADKETLIKTTLDDARDLEEKLSRNVAIYEAGMQNVLESQQGEGATEETREDAEVHTTRLNTTLIALKSLQASNEEYKQKLDDLRRQSEHYAQDVLTMRAAGDSFAHDVASRMSTMRNPSAVETLVNVSDLRVLLAKTTEKLRTANMNEQKDIVEKLQENYKKLAAEAVLANRQKSELEKKIVLLREDIEDMTKQKHELNTRISENNANIPEDNDKIEELQQATGRIELEIEILKKLHDRQAEVRREYEASQTKLQRGNAILEKMRDQEEESKSQTSVETNRSERLNDRLGRTTYSPSTSSRGIHGSDDSRTGSAGSAGSAGSVSTATTVPFQSKNNNNGNGSGGDNGGDGDDGNDGGDRGDRGGDHGGSDDSRTGSVSTAATAANQGEEDKNDDDGGDGGTGVESDDATEDAGSVRPKRPKTKLQMYIQLFTTVFRRRWDKKPNTDKNKKRRKKWQKVYDDRIKEHEENVEEEEKDE
jgi:hypothetical protein